MHRCQPPCKNEEVEEEKNDQSSCPRQELHGAAINTRRNLTASVQPPEGRKSATDGQGDAWEKKLDG
ncbi:Hypothetical protein SMAX5B_017319 [Scophthalmus maximus]|uniref:Uncharacterized protein n=1 Tax=Scophthalmus maximus TaxID=52904 RepID=A0A2U9CPV5_SCOMX|nr:Hypothetical protein SMAX5B_017319 [Scophthalmus maximus]